MDIKFDCTSCGTHIVIDEAGAGMAVQCPTCGASLIVPTAYVVCARGLVSEVLEPDEMATEGGIIKKFVINNKNWIPDCPQNVYEKIQRSLTEGDAKGETLRELTKRVQREFSGVDKERAYTIARTELQAAQGNAQFNALKKEGTTLKKWVDSGDELVRSSHRACAAQGAIPIDEPFCNGLMYPGDLSAGNPDECQGCRCYLISGDPVDDGNDDDGK